MCDLFSSINTTHLDKTSASDKHGFRDELCELGLESELGLELGSELGLELGSELGLESRLGLQTCCFGFSLCSDNGGFSLLIRFSYQVSLSLGFLLGDLLVLNGTGKLTAE
jgi:hypothetical protein